MKFLVLILLAGVLISAVEEVDHELIKSDLKIAKQSIPNNEVLNLRIQSSDNKNCDFKDRNVVERCSILLNPDKLFLNPWRWGMGKSGNWIGGPIRDATGSDTDGYAFADMSELLQDEKNNTAWLFTEPALPTEPQGRCMSFQYAIDGLSTKSFSVFIANYRTDDIESSDIDSSYISQEQSQNPNTTIPPKIVLFDLVPLIDVKDTTDGDWVEAKISYSSINVFSIVFVAKANHNFAQHRGYVAIDSILFTLGSCENDCSFDSDFCRWTNPTDRIIDDFDWTLGRSTNKRGTGPSRDQTSSVSYNLRTGGYIYIDSAYPRKSGDKAQLRSPEITATAMPMCLMFWVHMYGGGIGSLQVLRQIRGGQPTQLWIRSDTNGLDRWNPSQVTITAPLNNIYTVIFQADVGERDSGDIALDSVAFRDGPCPQLPPSSSDTHSRGDCTFLVNTCDWRLQQPPTLTTSFTPMLKQITGSYSTPEGKTQVPYNGIDYYMSFELGNYKHRVRDRAFLISSTIQNSIDGICLSFWVYMFTNVPTEMTVGALTVIVATSSANKTVWRLENKQHSRWEYAQVAIRETTPFQIFIQGTKGTKKNGMIAVDDITFFNSNCFLLPQDAFMTPFDCSFDSDQCEWKIETAMSLSPPPESRDRWRYADFGITLNVLMDHTYGIEKSGFMFIEAFNDDIISKLVSPKIDGEIDMCFSFYYASFFSDNTAELNVTSRNDLGEVIFLWRITQAQLPPRPEGHLEVDWNFGQVQLRGPTRIVVVAKVRNGGWAIDDIKFVNGTCLLRPVNAAVTNLQGATTTSNPAPVISVVP